MFYDVSMQIGKPQIRKPQTRKSLQICKLSALLASAIIFIAGNTAHSSESHLQKSIDLCLQQQVLNPENEQSTVAQLRQQCELTLRTSGADTVTNAALAADNSVTGTGLASTGLTSTDFTGTGISINSAGEKTAMIDNGELRRFFRPYKDNYLVAGRMKMGDSSVPFSGADLDIKFELGLTFSLFEGRENFDFLSPLHIGYSQKSWWNIAEESAPFTENNYNPEIYWLFNQPQRPLVGRFPFVDVVGLEHQSNGQAGLMSRSWDRVYAQKEIYLLPQFSIGVKIWDILSRDAANGDIANYLGNGQLSVMFRPNDRTNLRWRTMRGRDAKTFSHTFDIHYRRPNVNGAFFIQYQDGYGEALLTYKQKSQSLRAGLYFPLDIFD
jgi:phospholipase A1